jgi:hypothetical protein
LTSALSAPAEPADPPGSAASLVACVDRLTAAGFSAGLLLHLMEPTAVLHGWSSGDAAVAGAEIRVTAGVAADLHSAVSTALVRLQAHAQTWLSVEARLAVHRAQQRDQYAAAGSRLATLRVRRQSWPAGCRCRRGPPRWSPRSRPTKPPASPSARSS